MISPEIKELTAALSLISEGGFAGAASALGITQPAVSLRIAKLEQICGFPLFHRRTDGAALTPEGEQLLPLIREVEAEFSQVLRRLWYWQRAECGEVLLLADGSQEALALRKEDSTARPATEIWDRLNPETDWENCLAEYQADIVIAGSFLSGSPKTGVKNSLIRKENGLTAAWNPDYYEFSESDFNFPEAAASSVILPAIAMAPGFRKFLRNWCEDTYGFALSEGIIAATESEAVAACRQGIGVLLLPGDGEVRLGLRREGLSVATAFRGLLPAAFRFGIHYRSGERNPKVLATVESLLQRSHNSLESAALRS